MIRGTDTEEKIRKLLSGLPTPDMIPNQPGHATRLISSVIEAGGGLEEVRKWVRAHGGKESVTEVNLESTPLQAGRPMHASPRYSVAYFDIPADALAGRADEGSIGGARARTYHVEMKDARNGWKFIGNATGDGGPDAFKRFNEREGLAAGSYRIRNQEGYWDYTTLTEDGAEIFTE
jgi:hypothetical protein